MNRTARTVAGLVAAGASLLALTLAAPTAGVTDHAGKRFFHEPVGHSAKRF